MGSKRAQRWGMVLGLLGASACQTAPVPTHILLDVSVEKSFASGRVGLALLSAGSTDPDPNPPIDIDAGDDHRFVLVPTLGHLQFREAIVVTDGSQTIARVGFASNYVSGAERFLKIAINCDADDLGTLDTTRSEPATPLETCPGGAIAGRGGAGDSGGAGGSGGTAGRQTGGRGGASGSIAVDGGAGSDAGTPADRDAAIDSGAADGGGGSDAGMAGHGGAGGALAGTGGGAGAAAVGGGAGIGGLGGAGMGGAGMGGAGMGGAGTGGAGMGGAGGAAGGACYSLTAITPDNGKADLLTTLPGAFLGGIDTISDQSNGVSTYVCVADEVAGMPPAAVGKANYNGCFMPGSADAAPYINRSSMSVLVADNSCLMWKPWDGTSAPPTRIMLGDDSVKSAVCRVQHTDTLTGTDGKPFQTSGARVGQVRYENGHYVCRFEFYTNYTSSSTNQLITTTLINAPTEAMDYLDLAN